MRNATNRSVFPWLAVGLGAVVYWSVALGLGVPALGRLLGAPYPSPRAAMPVERHCLETVATDGRVFTFGDCVDVRFVSDSPEIPRPRQWAAGPHRTDPVLASPDPAVEEVGRSPMPEAHDSIGRTSY